MTKPRINYITTLVGSRGKGKTDHLKNMSRVSLLPKVLIVDTFDNPVWHDMETWDHPEGRDTKVPVIEPENLKYWRKGIYRCYGGDLEKIKKYIAEDLRNCFLIWEDASKYFGTELTKMEREFYYNTKQCNIDTFYTFHNLRRATVEIVENCDFLTLKKTGDNAKNIEKKYNNPEITALFESVKKHPDKYHHETIRIN